MSEGFTRPEARVLPEESLVPSESLIHPPPNRFTHETVSRTPFSYAATEGGGSGEDGSLAAGTKVVLLRTDDDEHRSAVVDGSGLYVLVASADLRPLTGS